MPSRNPVSYLPDLPESAGLGNIGKFIEERSKKTQEIKDILSKKQEESVPVLEKIRQEASSFPKPPELTPIPESRVENPFRNMIPALSAGLVFSAILGGMARVNFLQAMSGLAKGINAYHQGALEKYSLEKDQALQKMNEALRVNAQKIAEYRLALEKHKGDMAALEADLKTIALKYDDPMMIAKLDLEQYDKAVDWIVKQQEAQEKMRQNLMRLQIEAQKLAETSRYHSAQLSSRERELSERQRTQAIKDYEYYVAQTKASGKTPMSFEDFLRIEKPSIANLLPLGAGAGQGQQQEYEGLKPLNPQDFQFLDQ